MKIGMGEDSLNSVRQDDAIVSDQITNVLVLQMIS